MREILQTCIELDTQAAATYRLLSEACEDPDLASLFDQLAREEEAHEGWWAELLESWESGLIPDIVTDPDAILAGLRQVRDDVESIVPDDLGTLSPAQMLEVAVHLEFFMLDPLFAELIDLTEPGRMGHHREAYVHHIERLVGAIETHREGDAMARFLARVLKRALRDNTLLATYATRDPLTSLYNRRGMIGHLNHWVSWAHRYSRPLMVLLIDIDYFKEVNDAHGHLVGDEALQGVAKALGASTRESDLVARYGGDEFAIVAPETAIDEYPALVERIVGAVRSVRCEGRDGEEFGVTVSVGGAALALDSQLTTMTIDSLLAAADASMYEAKGSGRDQAGRPVVVDSEAFEASSA